MTFCTSGVSPQRPQRVLILLPITLRNWGGGSDQGKVLCGDTDHLQIRTEHIWECQTDTPTSAPGAPAWSGLRLKALATVSAVHSALGSVTLL